MARTRRATASKVQTQAVPSAPPVLLNKPPSPPAAPLAAPRSNKPPMMMFRLLCGCHYTRGPGKKALRAQQRHTPGDILESYQDLSAIFPNKFKRLFEAPVITEEIKSLAHKAAKRAVKEMLPAVARAQRGLSNTPTVRVVSRGGGRYDVVREDDGLPLNERPLTLDEAKAMENKSSELLKVAMKEPQNVEVPDSDRADKTQKDKVEDM